MTLSSTRSRRLRSRIMASVRGKHTGPEITVRHYLHLAGCRFRAHRKVLNITPDLVLQKYHAVLFVHGCFWHHHKYCQKAGTPKTRRTFWRNKFAANRKRDRLQKAELLRHHWRVGTIWECQLEEEALNSSLSRLVKWLKGCRRSLDIG